MGALYVILWILEVIVAVLLVAVILMQRSKGGGAVGVTFGGGMGEAIFGAQMGDFLTRATVILGFVFLANTLVLSILSANREGRSLMEGASRPAAAMPELPGDFGMLPETSSATPVAVPVPAE
ncbi:MAG: preprotein translocase subunit SecG [Lentisphaerae bacterium]|jgi:preprotein translocase subunit SecG|nr:preprotein translocase subunit SecG [Lentisphaerota bacterium]